MTIDARGLLKRARSGLHEAPCWTASGVDTATSREVLGAGRRGAVEWYGTGTWGTAVRPGVIIDGSAILLRDRWLDHLPDDLRSAVGDGWLRQPLKPLRADSPDVMPADMLSTFFADRPATVTGDDTVGGRRLVTITAGSPAQQWRIDVDDLSFDVAIPSRSIHLSVSYEDGPLPIDLPDERDVVDLRAHRRLTPRITVVDAPGERYEVDVLPPEPEDDEAGPEWTVMDYELNVALGLRDNYEAEELVTTQLAHAVDGLDERVSFDSESGCFFAYCDTEQDARALASLIAELVAYRRVSL